MTVKIIISLVFLLLTLPVVSFTTEQPENYCDDTAAWEEWDKLLTDSPMDDGISSLYAFRVGLCSMVKSGQIETARAIQLFEGMRDAVLKGLYAAEEENKGKGAL